MRIFFVFLGLAAVEEGEGSIKAVSLAGSDKIIDIEFVSVFSTCACVKVQFCKLYFAGNGEGILDALNPAINRGSLKENIFHLVYRKITLVLLKFLGKSTVQSV